MKKLFTLFVLVIVYAQSQAQSISNSGMETWKSYTSLMLTMEKPNDWNTLDSIVGALKQLALKTYSARVVKSSTVKHSGSFSARLYTTSGDSFPTLLSNGNVKFDLTLIADLTKGDFSKLKFSGGTTVSKRIHFAKAYVQYSSLSSTDKGTFTVTAFKNGIGAGGTDSVVGSGSVDVTPSATFVQREVYLTYVNGSIVPDRLVFTFNAGTNFPPTGGSELYVDDVTYSDPLGIDLPAVNESSVRVFPNPAIDELTLQTGLKQALYFTMYNSIGRPVLHHTFVQNDVVSLAQLPAGTYLYTLSGQDGHLYYGATLIKQ